MERLQGRCREGEGHHGHVLRLRGHLFRVLFVGSSERIRMDVRGFGDVVGWWVVGGKMGDKREVVDVLCCGVLNVL